MTVKKIVLSLLAATTALTISSGASAATVYSNGVADNNNGHLISFGYTSADDFRLAAASTVQSMTFNTLSLSPVTALTYSIFAAGNAGPGTLLTTGPAQSLLYTATGGTLYGYNKGLVSFNFASAFAAAANTTYWVGLNSSQNEIYWATAADNSTANAVQKSSANGATFANINQQLAFTLGDGAATGAVPEPATWAMMLLGMSAVGYAMRRKSKVTTKVAFA